MRLPRLYPIADAETLRRHGLPLSVFVQQLVAGGAEILQLRDKQGTPADLLRQAEVVSRGIEGSPCLPVMNDRADLAWLAGWRAVHVGHRDLPPEAVRKVLGEAGPEALVGVSTHNGEQVRAAEASSANYVAVGPVFSTGTKADAEPVIGLEGVRQARALTRKPIVAIGGIALANAPDVLAAGADSVAVIGALFGNGDSVEAKVRDFLRRLR